jgi:acyl-CoA hydrolase
MSSPLRVWYAEGPGHPRTAPREALAAAGVPIDAEFETTLGWTIERLPWLDEPDFTATTVVAGYALSKPINEGRINAFPIRLSAIAAHVATQQPDVAVVAGVPRGSGFAFGASVGWNDVLALNAKRVVIEVDRESPDLGSPPIEGNVVAVVDRPAAPGSPAVGSRHPDHIDIEIGRRVAALLPDDCTVQFGSGGFGDGIAMALSRPVRIHSGLVTESMARLLDRELLAAPVTAAYAWGDEAISRLSVHQMLRMVPISVTHDLTAMSRIPRFVSCNTALQFSLDGDANVERVGGRIIAPVGGHSDFCTGASRSPGGIAVIAMRSTTADGTSNIVDRCEVVSTQRSDIQILVTEHGVADLRGLGDRERARRIADVAAPEHRERLLATRGLVG